jgi:pimeloyl-ACP methyl ester carboxylesterase
VRIRYVKTGKGPDLVLLHTIRTQLDIWADVITELDKDFTVYAFDNSGHGWSSLPRTEYVPDRLYRWTEQFLDAIDARDATVAGISIGGTIGLELASRGNRHVARVVAINPYDYVDGLGTGLAGSSPFARIMATALAMPVAGGVLIRLTNPLFERLMFLGGVATPESLSDDMFAAMARAGDRPGAYQAFLQLRRPCSNLDLFQ